MSTPSLLAAALSLGLCLAPATSHIFAAEQPTSPVTKEQSQRQVGFLGVNVRPVPEELSSHLDLERGVGLTITEVGEDSPAAAAGLKSGDILTKLDDQILITQRQLAVLVHNRPGVTVHLTYIRAGQSASKALALGSALAPRISSHEPPPLAPHQPQNRNHRLPFMGDDLPPALRQQLQQMFDNLDHSAFDDLEKRLKDLEGLRGQPTAQRRAFTQHQAAVHYNDGTYSYILTENHGARNLVVKDAAGSVVYQGELDDNAQIKDLPQAVQDGIKSFTNTVQLFSGGPKPE